MQVVVLSLALGLDNGVGRTPPQGFNPWNVFGISAKGTCKLDYPWKECHGFNETVILEVARAIAATPLKQAGYEYVNLDCGDTGFRGADGSLTVNTTRYPHGMKWLGDRIHELGLKFGMYSDAGKQQCCSRVYGPKVNDGSLGHEKQDAETFASWGVDYLKHDSCGEQPSSYPAMRDALNATGRPIYYSIHGPKLVPAIANLWRTTGDIDNNWGSIVQRAIWNSEAYASNREAVHAGAFNDPDMLEVGNLWGPLGDAEGRSHFSMWSVMKAPLLIGTDVTNMTAETLNTLTHEGVIAINQDPLAVQATLLPPPPAEAGAPPPPPGTNATQLTWAGPLAKGSYVALLVNNREVPQTLEFDTTALGGGPFAVTELWTGVKVKFGRTLKLPDVGGHDCALLRFDPKTAP